MNQNSNLRLGIMGGTFDPIHNGHLMIARAALEEYHLTKVIFIPTGISYMKSGVSDSCFRYEMTRYAIEDTADFEISDIEILRKGNTYTWETIQYFKEQYSDAKLFFIIGSDSLFSLDKWKKIRYILENCTILCATRLESQSEILIRQKEQEKAKELYEQYNGDIQFLHCQPFDISSTEIRDYRRNHPSGSLYHLGLPRPVADYITRQDLYSEATEKIHMHLKEQIKPKRFRHTMGVVDTSVKLAKRWGCDLVKVRFAALLHDCAKYLDTDAKLALCQKYNVSVTQIERNNPELLHAKAGALLAYDEYGIENPAVLSAIFYHTTGKPDMSLLEQIIFVADYIEPGRNHSKSLPFYRELAMQNLNKLTALILKDTLAYLKKKQEETELVIDPFTKKTFDFYKQYLNDELDISLL